MSLYSDRGLKCPVCLLEFEEEEAVKKMPCEHFFHSGCIVPWLGKVSVAHPLSSPNIPAILHLIVQLIPQTFSKPTVSYSSE